MIQATPNCVQDFKIPVLTKLTADIKSASRLLTNREARYLVDLYYQLQDARLRCQGQLRAIDKCGDDVKGADSLLNHFFSQFESLERQMVNALGAFALSKPVGKWAQSICGIGPVLSAGLIANIDIHRAPHVSHVWSFAGLANKPWGKGEKRPFNADFKALCAYKIGESFVKVQNNDNDFYGHLFRQKKDQMVAANESGAFADAAAKSLSEKRYGVDTDAFKAYSTGKLPPAHIHARARRWTVKLFLSHFHQVYFEDTFQRPAPKPWIIDFGGHADYMPPPNYEPL